MHTTSAWLQYILRNKSDSGFTLRTTTLTIIVKCFYACEHDALVFRKKVTNIVKQ